MVSEPTLAVRTILNTSYVHDKASASLLEVFPCYPVTEFTFSPMSPQRFSRIPINFVINNATHDGFMDLLTNVIYFGAPKVDCLGKRRLFLYVERTFFTTLQQEDFRKFGTCRLSTS